MGRSWITRGAWLLALTAIGALALDLAPADADDARPATCENPSPTVIPEDWAKQHLAEGSEYYNALFSPAARQKSLSAPPLAVRSFPAGGASRQAKYMADGALFVDRTGPVQSFDNVDWSTMDYGAYYATQLHGLASVVGFLEAHEKMPEDVASMVGAFIANWARCAARNPDINPRAWYEGTVIKRQSTLLHALNYMRRFGEFGNLTYDELIYLIDANARYLLDTPKIYALGNHGIRQDMLLAATALSLPSHPRSTEMLRLAERRLDDAADKLFTESGIWAEHAPGYVHYILRLMLSIKTLHEEFPQFNPKRFLHNFDRSLEYLLAVLLPNGQIPYVGESLAEDITTELGDYVTETQGQDARSLLKDRAYTLAAFTDYGHAVVRGSHPDGLYLLFVASQNLPARKRNADDLSFILYNYGRAWITEGGGHKHHKHQEMTKYLRSAFAHNTYTLNGSFIPGEKERELETELITAVKEGATIRLSGFSERFPTLATFEREIEIRDFSSLVIRDSLKSEAKDAHWEGRFQIAGDLTVAIDGHDVKVTDPKTGRVMAITFASEAPIALSTCRAEKQPVCGWGGPSREFGPATTLTWSFEQDATIEINIGWGDEQAAKDE